MKMADQIRYGAGGVPYVGPGGEAPAPAPVPEEKKEEPEVKLAFEEDDTPLTDEQVIKKAKGNGK